MSYERDGLSNTHFPLGGCSVAKERPRSGKRSLILC